MAFPGLKKACDRLLSDSQSTKTNVVKSKFIEECYQQGGKSFVAAVEKWGVNERGDRLTLLPWHREYIELIGDFRVAETLTSGAAQVGKTLIHTLLVCYCITEGGLSTIWSYDLERSLDIQVPTNFRPVIKAWLKIRGIKTKLGEGTQNNTIFQVKGATAQFIHVSTSKMRDADDGKAAVGGVAAGVSRDILFKEERSQYPPGAGDPLNRRLDAGRLPSRPIRELGTPGAGNGIEAEIVNADYHFYPHYRCPSCGEELPLHPKGCLLKSLNKKYLSPSGRPLDWFRENNEAFFGCPSCGDRISDETRKQAWFRCLKTGVDLRDFLDSLPQGVPYKRLKVGIILSPLLRIRQTNLAQEMINEGLSVLNTDDWQQQGLGEPSETSSTGVTLEILKGAIALPPPPGKPEFTLVGIDQGRSEYWLWKCAYHLPVNWRSLPTAQVIDQSRRHILFGGDVMKGEIPDLLDNVDYGIIDNEPDITAAAELCSITCLEMGDQQSSLLDAVKEGVVREGGNEHKCWKLRNEKFLKTVLHGFLLGKYHLPNEWEQWIGKPTERSPLIHLTAPSFDPSSGKWKRPKNHVDDLYYAAMFCEVAFYLHLLHGQKQSGFDLWSAMADQ
ncbi:hypothetical protein ACX27_04335 [Nostoc piscinale CENA21]|uniref:Terminase n=1 Tax=Nostoc piscinale CENA21 TaxID=224013 RepID=A0A0M3V4N7_9NOSO|nr:phage terminase large subunit family protein [Nostoc piscinale]ALF52257.1 hypothetical protein ACX27_04335 [Nostoc piscinale CENA21]